MIFSRICAGNSLMLPMTALFLAGCSGASNGDGLAGADNDQPQAPSRSEAMKAAQGYFDENPLCSPFFAMPHDVPVDSSWEQQRMDAFIKAGLLQRQGEVEKGESGMPSRRYLRYDLTAEGREYIRPGAGGLKSVKAMICYGRRKVTAMEVGSADTFGTRFSMTYRYRLSDVPGWARSAPILERYPVFKDWLDKEKEDHGTLIHEGGRWKMDGDVTSGLFDFQQLSH